MVTKPLYETKKKFGVEFHPTPLIRVYVEVCMYVVVVVLGVELSCVPNIEAQVL